MKIKNFIQATWQCPQNIVGCIVQKIYKATLITTYKDANVYSWSINSGMSLGKYIFIPYKNPDLTKHRVQQYIKHEYGHTMQSKYLGWLYLLVIGLPSAVWNKCFQSYREKTGKSYYSFFTERWADQLGSVERSQ